MHCIKKFAFLLLFSQIIYGQSLTVSLTQNIPVDENNVEIEIPYYKGFKDTDVIKIDKKSYTINFAKNLGDRDELIVILTNTEKNNEHKQAESIKATKA